MRLLTAAVVEALLAEDLIRVGLPQGGPDFAEEDLTPQEAGDRILRGWDADPLPVQVALWMRASIHGLTVGTGLRTDEVIDAAVLRAADAARRTGYDLAPEARRSG